VDHESGGEHDPKLPEAGESAVNSRVEEKEVTEAPSIKEVGEEDEQPTPPPKSIRSRSKAKPKSYLDEILAERSDKKRKKNKSKAQADI
jgi:hypothetical protein